MTPQVTLDTCAQEPIHIPGSIQPHGLLYVLRGDRVVQASANVPGGVDAVLGKGLDALFAPPSAQLIADAAAHPDRLREINPLRVRTTAGDPCDAVLHFAVPGVLVIELEAAAELLLDGAVFDPRLRKSVMLLQNAHDVTTLCAIAAEQVRTISGFDRVMVYRFDREWNGEVVAEHKRADLEPFLGQHYPASDIPAQARRLYTVNWLRFIGDVAYKPVPIVPTLEPETQAPLDLSHSVLRSVSPIHIEYLTNMGVSASMSVSLVIDGVLAGLIACHHYSGPRIVSFRTRETAEFLGRQLSWHLRVVESADRAERARASKTLESELVRAVATTPDLLDGLATETLTALTESSGAAVVLQDGVRKVGEAPPGEALAALVAWLTTNEHDVFSTDAAARDIPIDLGGAAGVLAVAVSRTLGEYLLWFRPSTERTVNWGGEPAKVVTSTDGSPPRLSPRGSFALWRETVRGRSLPWDQLHIEAASNVRKTLLGGVRLRASELRTLNQRLLEADRAKDDFIATVSHELRTPLHAILGWTQLLELGTVSPEKLKHGIEVISRNARAQTQIVDDLLDVSRMVSGKLTLDVATVDLVELTNSVIDSLEVATTAKSIRIKRVLDTSAQPVLGDAARLRQVLANLLNNALKFTPKGGSITVVLQRQESDIELSVVDTGRGIEPELIPLIFDVFKQGDGGMNRRSQGLGLGLALARKLVELHGGRIRVESAGVGKGAAFHVRIPLSPIQPPAAAGVRQHGAQPLNQPLAGLAILVVEDEQDARDLLALVLRAAGAEVVAVPDPAAALDVLAARPIAIVISDIGMPGSDGLTFMRALRALPSERGSRVPAIALTAYTRAHDRTAALQAGFDAHVPKPVDTAELITVVTSVVGRLRR